MTPASLRTLMARAFADEVEKQDHYRRGQQFINELGISAAMRVAAEHCHDCPNVFNPRVYLEGQIASAKHFLTALGEIT